MATIAIILDPLHGLGYDFWSGIGSGSPILAGVAVYWRHHNCHIRACPRLTYHPHPDHGHPVCKKHHPDDPPEGDRP